VVPGDIVGKKAGIKHKRDLQQNLMTNYAKTSPNDKVEMRLRYLAMFRRPNTDNSRL
jgi:hypothetical protein